MSDLGFDGKVAIITGAGGGLGKQHALSLAKRGALVVVNDLGGAVDGSGSDATAAQLVVDEIKAAGGEAVANTDSVATPEGGEAIVQTALDAFGRIDIVVNNAGILRDGMLWKLTDEDYAAVIDVHAGGTYRFTRAAVPQFREQGGGRIINVTSYTGLHGNLGQANYAIAKAGIIGFTKTAAKELARFNITVNAISPNAETRMVASIPEGRRREIAATIPMGRFGAPSEMAAAVAFLASDEAGYITGVVLPVDGGLSI